MENGKIHCNHQGFQAYRVMGRPVHEGEKNTIFVLLSERGRAIVLFGDRRECGF